MTPLTLENIADSAIAEGLATREEIEAAVLELYKLAADGTTLLAFPRIVQAWGYGPVKSGTSTGQSVASSKPGEGRLSAAASAASA
jgi:hypothetical protein